MADGRFVTYETLHEGRIARIWLNRPDARNAQNYGLLGELDEAFLRAEADEDVRVVILGGLGPAFSAGHDLGTPERLAENEAMAVATDRRGGPRSAGCASSGTTSRTRAAGATCARSRSRRCTATASPPG